MCIRDSIYISFIPGINEYREDHLQGDWIFDARVGYTITKNSKVQFLVKNMFNRMYALRPCLLYTSDAADERSSVDLGGRRIIKKKKKQTIDVKARSWS